MINNHTISIVKFIVVDRLCVCVQKTEDDGDGDAEERKKKAAVQKS